YERSVVAFDVDGPDVLHGAGGHALAPRGTPRARPEVGHPGRERPLYGRPVHPGHHEELARVRFLDHGGDQPLRVELELVDRHGSQRTSTPRSLRYALSSARVCVPK